VHHGMWDLDPPAAPILSARGYLDDNGPMEGATLLHHIACEPQRTRLPDISPPWPQCCSRQAVIPMPKR
jgi:hypothetical protein